MELREKVINGLECCMSGQPEGLGCDRVPCPYCDFEDCEGMLHRDALALLKAQDAVKPTRKPEIFDSLYFCGKCSAKIGFQIRKDDSWRFKCNYCPECGMAVKWE